MTEEARIQFLIVEDEQSIRRLCTTIGASLGLACLEADSAEAALQQIEAHAPELIVTDLKLPRALWHRPAARGAQAAAYVGNRDHDRARVD